MKVKRAGLSPIAWKMTPTISDVCGEGEHESVSSLSLSLSLSLLFLHMIGSSFKAGGVGCYCCDWHTG